MTGVVLLLNSSIPSLHDVFHSTAFVLARNLIIFVAIVFWLALAFWVYRDARRRIDDPWLVAIAALLGLVPPYLGPVVYLLFRPAETIDDVRARRVELLALEEHLAHGRPACPVCNTVTEPDFLVCPVCATPLREACSNCDAPLEPLWQVCPYCAHEVRRALEPDVDAALTAELRERATANGHGELETLEPRTVES